MTSDVVRESGWGLVSFLIDYRSISPALGILLSEAMPSEASDQIVGVGVIASRGFTHTLFFFFLFLFGVYLTVDDLGRKNAVDRDCDRSVVQRS